MDLHCDAELILESDATGSQKLAGDDWGAEEPSIVCREFSIGIPYA